MSDPRKHGYLSNRAGQQLANEKELREENERLQAQLERARSQFQRIMDNKTATSELHESWEHCAINMDAIAKQALRELDQTGGGE